MYRTYKGQGLVLIGIHSDKDWNKGKSSAKENKVAYPITNDQNGATGKAYKIMGYPTVFLIDKKGVVRAVDPSDLGKAVKAALAKK